jgi:carboxyl-terminal processing protease
VKGAVASLERSDGRRYHCALPQARTSRTIGSVSNFAAFLRAPALALLAAGVLGACAAAPRAPQRAPVDPSVAAATFDTVWTVVERTLWDPEFGGLDWAGVRDEMRPRAVAARTQPELRAVLAEMLGRLGMSHFGVIPREVDESLTPQDDDRERPSPGEAGVEVRLVDGEALVTRVRPGSAAADAGVRPGWILERAGTVRPADALERLEAAPDGGGRMAEMYVWGVASRALSGPAGDTVRATFVDGAGARHARALELREVPGVRTRVGQLAEMTAHLEHGRQRTAAGTDVGIIRMNLWMPVLAPRLDRAVDELRGADGIVVDLRGNLGGIGFMAAGAAGHFHDRGDTLGTMVTRRDSVHLFINPRRSTADGRAVTPFAGPVAVLVDGISASTSEFFAGGMQALGRARVFGTRTAGQAVPAWTRRLPNGDVLMHAIADFVGPGGVRWEGEGVVPDEEVPLTREALLAGRDPAMEAALRWIDAQGAGSGPR